MPDLVSAARQWERADFSLFDDAQLDAFCMGVITSYSIHYTKLYEKPVLQIGPVFGAAVVTLSIGRLPDSGLPAYVIEAPFLYRREGNPYVGPDGHDWSDNHRRFGLLGWVAAHLASGELDSQWVPDVVHAHDWHAGLASAYIVQNPGLKT